MVSPLQGGDHLNELPRRRQRGIAMNSNHKHLKRRGNEPVGAVKKTAKDIFFDVSNLNRAFDCPI
jgi:hypothetical protein